MIDVIIPTFNRAEVLERAIESVFSQTYQNFKIYVVDDGSTDKTEKICKKWNKFENFNYLKIENNGVSYARNYAVKNSKSPWIAFLDSDDEWLPHKLEEQISIVNKYSDSVLIHGEELWIRNGKRVNQKKIHKKSGGDIFERSLSLCLISPSASMVKRELFESFNGFNESFPVCEDYDLWLKITARHHVHFIETPIIKKYGGHEDQLSRKFFAMDFWRVLSMHELYQKSDISSCKKAKIIPVIKKKCEILINGYEKHSNINNLDTIKKIKDFFDNH